MTTEMTNDNRTREQLLQDIDALQKRCDELQEQLANVDACNRCGRASRTAPLKVNDDVMRRYFRSMLGQIPFTHTITALDGMLSATFMLQRGDVLVAKYNEKADAEGKDIESMIASTLVSVKVIDKTAEIEKVVYSRTPEELAATAGDWKKGYSELLNAVDLIQLAFVKTACSAFVVLVSTIIDSIQSEDFFEGAGLL